MKKICAGFLFCIFLLSCLVGCQVKEQNVSNKMATAKKADNNEKLEVKKDKNSNDSIEEPKEETVIDLSEMTEQLAYAKVIMILSDPYKYENQTVKMKGKLTIIEAEDGNVYYSCSVTDNPECTCCPSGFEFVSKDGTYPKEGTEITLMGTFCSYKDPSGETYFHVDDSVYIG
ncbi:MAG: hypothetical protein K5895_04760 [Lachnospiraceae bacterium]|nr:hypothetical protein [Lachnospiraceae bacterium]